MNTLDTNSKHNTREILPQLKLNNNLIAIGAEARAEQIRQARKLNETSRLYTTT